MITPHLFYQIYLSFFSAKWLHSTKIWWTVRKHWQCSHRGGRSFFGMYEWVRYDRCRHDIRQLHPSSTACSRTANLPGPAWQNEACLQRNIPIIVPRGKNILVNIVFKISIGYTNHDTRQIQSRFGSRIYLFIASNANMAGYATKISLLAKFKKTLSYHHTNQGMFQLYML